MPELLCTYKGGAHHYKLVGRSAPTATAQEDTITILNALSAGEAQMLLGLLTEELLADFGAAHLELYTPQRELIEPALTGWDFLYEAEGPDGLMRELYEYRGIAPV
ncbi:hypothetical protein [Kordiimonas laminariae]|uniref:hypothetical protein n=1 Tax=Kordiimonas laminariae TaxID=2917717 RepID=UPI001FF435E3|nr:hypothetical protein [Kordiimonas laminariae]MCK0068317.1 hypothetical protein [Kordiimonas laminariae]